MSERLLKSLYDINAAIDEITSFFDGRERRFSEYQKDLLLKRGVERNLEIIGEAMNRILKEDANIPVRDAHRIVGLRNQIIHGYDSVSDENIWAVVMNHLPKLKQDVQKLIDSYRLWFQMSHCMLLETYNGMIHQGNAFAAYRY